MGRKFFLKCHLIFCIKYRKKILDETFCKHLREIFYNIENKSNFKIDIFEFDKDHVHFLIDYEPQIWIQHDRDINAAINIKNFGILKAVRLERPNHKACGDEGILLSMKQEECESLAHI